MPQSNGVFTSCCSGGENDMCYDNSACSPENGECMCTSGFYFAWNQKIKECRSCDELHLDLIEDGQHNTVAKVKQRAGCEEWEPSTTIAMLTTSYMEQPMGGALAPSGRFGKK